MHRTSDALIEVHNRAGAPLRVVNTGRKGRAVVSERRIEAGALIERAPVLIVPETDRAAVDPSNIGNYIFRGEAGTPAEALYARRGRAAVVLGFASLLNHSAEPNCDFIRYIDALALDLVALRTIGAGEELAIDYGLK